MSQYPPGQMLPPQGSDHVVTESDEGVEDDEVVLAYRNDGTLRELAGRRPPARAEMYPESEE